MRTVDHDDYPSGALFQRPARRDDMSELDAIKTAEPTPGADTFLVAGADTGRLVVMASNNNAEAIAAYLDRHQLAQFVARIEGRDPEDARRMKPNPWVIRRALAHATALPSDAVLIGDAVTDVEAARTPPTCRSSATPTSPARPPSSKT